MDLRAPLSLVHCGRCLVIVGSDDIHGRKSRSTHIYWQKYDIANIVGMIVLCNRHYRKGVMDVCTAIDRTSFDTTCLGGPKIPKRELRQRIRNRMDGLICNCKFQSKGRI